MKHYNNNNKKDSTNLKLPIHTFLSMQALHDMHINKTNINDPLSSNVKYLKFKPHDLVHQNQSIITDYQCFPHPLWKTINSFFNTTC